jgi:site-specific DNA recombinase
VKQGIGPTDALSVGLFFINGGARTMIFAYLRTSVQKKNKISIEMQLAAIKEKAADLQLPELQESQVFVDRGVSGAKFKERQGLQELLQVLGEPSSFGSTLLVYRFDRLSRDINVMLEILGVLESNEIKLISVMESSLEFRQHPDAENVGSCSRLSGSV